MFLNNSVQKTKQIFLNLRNRNFAILITFIVVLKNGIHPIGTDWVDWLFEAARKFPDFESYFSSSIIPIFAVRVFDFPTVTLWWIINFIIYIVILSMLIRHLNKFYSKDFRKIFILISTLPLFISPLLYLGHYDVYTIAAALVVFITKRKYLIILASLLASLTNPEQSLVTAFCLFFIYLGTKQKSHRDLFVIWSTNSITVYVLVKFLVSKSAEGDRSNVILGQVKYVVIESAGLVNLLMFSLFGVFWFWIFIYVIRLKNFYTLIGLVIIPLILIFVILDHTRVGVAVGAAPLLIIIRDMIEKRILDNFSVRFFYLYFGIYLFIPQIFVDFDSTIRLPYSEFIKVFLF